MNTAINETLQNRGIAAWVLALVLITFYVLLYWGEDIDRGFILNSYLTDINAQIEQGSGASHELKIQKKLILSTVMHSDKYKNSGGFHPQLNQEYFALVTTMKASFSAAAILHTVSSWLNPVSMALRNKPASKWFLYSFLYTVMVVLMGIRFIRRWQDNSYQKLRTLSTMFFQLVIAFLLPSIMVYFNSTEFYFSYFWPLKVDYFFPGKFYHLPRAMALWTLMMSFIAVPVLTYFFGKRWYCSWVCGCGALAETAGDPFRHLSSKTERAWKIERVSIYSVLVLVIFATALLWINEVRHVNDGYAKFSFQLKRWYGFFVVSGFAGVIGTGFYPLAGSRIWCRFGCPQAAILGVIQVWFSKFRITTNGDQCMSCGNCSTYCEMGIDVRAYAMEGKDIQRASCVGCGMCATVCPRGVLKLENSRGLLQI